MQTNKKTRVLYASRAFESAPNEGGFVVLRDLATGVIRHDIDAGVFSVTNAPHNNPEKIKAFARTCWSRSNAVRFAWNLIKHQRNYNIVHMAHMPTLANAGMMRFIAGRGRARGVKYVQTITALPAHGDGHDISGLLWGDHITCLNERIYNILRAVRHDVTLQPAIPSPARLAASLQNHQPLARNSNRKIVLFPFHFMHLPEGFRISEVTAGLLQGNPDIDIIIAFRLTEETRATQLRNSLPPDLRKRVMVVNAQENILDYLRISDLMIYPLGNSIRKFNPPLIVLEAAALNCRMIINDTVELPTGFMSNAVVRLSSNTPEDWISSAHDKLSGNPCHKIDLHSLFNNYVTGFINIYKDLL